MNKQISVDQVYDDFWKNIIENDHGIDIVQMKKELYDFWMMIQEVPKVYDHVTGGQVSKPLTSADVVNSLADEYYDGICQEHIEDMKLGEIDE